MLMSIGQGVTISIDDAYAFNGVYGAASYQLAADGNINVSPYGFLSSWISKPSASSLFEARMTLINGFLTSTGALVRTDPNDTSSIYWLNLGTSREWAFSTFFSSGTADCNLEIRRVATPAIILDSATITFDYIGSFA
jgi:hypothetical protein